MSAYTERNYKPPVEGKPSKRRGRPPLGRSKARHHTVQVHDTVWELAKALAERMHPPATTSGLLLFLLRDALEREVELARDFGAELPEEIVRQARARLLEQQGRSK